MPCLVSVSSLLDRDSTEGFLRVRTGTRVYKIKRLKDYTLGGSVSRWKTTGYRKRMQQNPSVGATESKRGLNRFQVQVQQNPSVASTESKPTAESRRRVQQNPSRPCRQALSRAGRRFLPDFGQLAGPWVQQKPSPAAAGCNRIQVYLRAGATKSKSLVNVARRAYVWICSD